MCASKQANSNRSVPSPNSSSKFKVVVTEEEETDGRDNGCCCRPRFSLLSERTGDGEIKDITLDTAAGEGVEESRDVFDISMIFRLRSRSPLACFLSRLLVLSFPYPRSARFLPVLCGVPSLICFWLLLRLLGCV